MSNGLLFIIVFVPFGCMIAAGVILSVRSERVDDWLHAVMRAYDRGTKVDPTHGAYGQHPKKWVRKLAQQTHVSIVQNGRGELMLVVTCRGKKKMEGPLQSRAAAESAAKQIISCIEEWLAFSSIKPNTVSHFRVRNNNWE